MRIIILFLLMLCGFAHADSVSAISIGQNITAIENGVDNGVDTLYSIYYNNGYIVYSARNQPMKNLTLQQALAFAEQNGFIK